MSPSPQIHGPPTAAARNTCALRIGLGVAMAAWLLIVSASCLWNCSPGFRSFSSRTEPGPHLRLHVAGHAILGVFGLAAIFIGYRALRRSRESLLSSEERYRLISSVAMDYVFSSMVEPSGNLSLQWVAGAFESITGYSYEEYVATGGWRTKLHPDDVEQDTRDIEVLRTNQPLRNEIRTIAKDGRTVWVEVVAYPVWDARRNQLAGIYGAVRDITRRKQAEAETRAALDTLKQFVDSIPAFGAFVDAEERYQLVNRFYEEWFNQPRESFIGRRLSDVHRPSTYEKMRPYSRQALSGRPVHYQHDMTGRDGKPYVFDVQYIPRRASDGSIAGYFTLVFDITEHIALEHQLLRTQRLESVGRLASGIAHDLNNILSPILMAPELLRDAIQDPSARETLDLVEVSAMRGAAILRQLLIFGRGEQQHHAPLLLGPLVKEMVKIIQETFPRNIAVSSRIDADLPAVNGNLTQLHQVLMNLCINARDAMPGGGQLDLCAGVRAVDETTAQRHAVSAGTYVALAVTDSGSGIPPEILDKIFDPFFTTKPVGEGTGLGLSTVLGIARGHQGFIQVDSRPGNGTCFTVCLPVCLSAPAAPEVLTPSAELPRGQGQWLLLVDDEEQNRRVVRQMLEHHGYNILEARNGQEALTVFEHDPSRIHLVITDLMMPVMNGATLVRRLRQLRATLPTIAMTGGVTQPEMAQAIESETSAFLIKPFSPRLLLETIQRALHR